MPVIAKKKRISIAVWIMLSLVVCSAYVVFHQYVARHDPFRAGPKAPATIVIQSRIGDGPWIKDPAIYPLKGQRVTLKVDEVPGASIKWYRILPDISKIYSNCNHPWQKDPYKGSNACPGQLSADFSQA